MGRILYFAVGAFVFYVTYQVAMKSPRWTGSAYTNGVFTALALFASLGVYCLYKATSSRS